MKKVIFTAFVLIFSISAFSQSYEGETISYKFYSNTFEEEREIKIFLPVDYELEPELNFPVIYLFDGQDETLFNLTKSTLDFLLGSYEIQPILLVGILSSNRKYEFLPKNTHDETSKRYKSVGGINKLIKSLENEIFSYIKENYRTSSTRIGIGTSLGATFLTNTLIDNPTLFNGMILISPNYAYDREQIFDSVDKIADNIKENDTYLYSIIGDTGKLENEFIPGLKKIDSIFKSKELNLNQWSTRVMENYNHNTILLEGIQKGLLDYSNKFDLTKINKNGNQEVAKNNFIKAFVIFQRGIELYPNDSNIYNSYGKAKEKSGNLKRAKELYSIALEKLKKEKDKYKEKEFLSRKNTYVENYNRVNK